MISVARFIAVSSGIGVIGLMGYHVFTGADVVALGPLPAGIASTMAPAVEENKETIPVKANVVVFRAVPSGNPKFGNIIAAHEFDKATDQKPASGWCYVEVLSTAEDPVRKTIQLHTFNGEMREDDSLALKGFSRLGLNRATLDQIRSRCPWSGHR